MGASAAKPKSEKIEKKNRTCSSSSDSNGSDSSAVSGHSSGVDNEDRDSASSNQGCENRAGNVVRKGASERSQYETRDSVKDNEISKTKESKFVETSEFPYARAKLVHPHTRRENQEARQEVRRIETTSSDQQDTTPPLRPKQAKHVVFGGQSQDRAESTTNPHMLWRLHKSGHGINVTPCTISRRVSDHMPLSTWRNPNRMYTYFNDQHASLSSVDPEPSIEVSRYASTGAFRPPTPCTPANSSIWDGTANAMSITGFGEEERKALIRAQYKIELEAIRQMTNQYSRMSTTGHR